jgi:hypothetical protein
MNRASTDTTWTYNGVLNPRLNFGEMVKLKYVGADSVSFRWNRDTSGIVIPRYVHPRTRYFEYEEEADYLPIYLALTDDMKNDYGGEVGLFIDNVCYGAEVVVGDTVQINAYILETEFDENAVVEFRYHDYNTRGGGRVKDKYRVYDTANRAFEDKKLDLSSKEIYYMISLREDDPAGGNVIPFVTSLGNNYPNPFNPSTTISYSLGEQGNVKLNIYNIKGQLVKTLVSEVKEAGRYKVIWNGDDNNLGKVSSGVYFYRMETKTGCVVKKMLLLK